MGFNRSRHAIMEALSEGQVASDDRRAVFVGADTYQAAGGVIVRDLFDEEGGGFFADAVLLNRLVREKLAVEAAKIEAEGWKWIVVEPEFSHEMTAGMRRVHPEEVRLSEEDQARMDELVNQYNALTDEDDGENSEEIAAKLQALDAEMDALSGAEQYRPEDIAVAGVYVSLSHHGEPRIERGFVRAEDWKAKASAAKDAEPDAEGETGKADGSKPLSEKLVAELTAYRTAGLRNALAEHSAMALAAVVHALAAATFYRWSDRITCLEIAPRSASLSSHAAGIDECPAMIAIAERHAAWERRLPQDAAALWDFVARLHIAGQIDLLAHCASLTLNAIHLPKQRMDAVAAAQADVLAQTLGLDMTATWSPTVASYFGRVSKERIVEAVREGVSVEAARNIAGMKKQAMAEAAEQRLAGTGWLPELLRTGAIIEPAAEQAA
jgi:ParB family transcriptional regulator, chromosome partitioning protein